MMLMCVGSERVHQEIVDNLMLTHITHVTAHEAVASCVLLAADYVFGVTLP